MAEQQFKREPAVRIFAQELSRIKIQLEKKDDGKGNTFTPSYYLSPTGARVNHPHLLV